MIDTRYCVAMSDYNRWMNTRLYDICADLSDTERRQDRDTFFRSIHGTLNHLMVADLIWLGRFTRDEFPATSLDQELYGDFAELRRQRRLLDERVDKWVRDLTDDQLAAPFSWRSFLNPAPRMAPLWKPVAHFFNHQTHHRGQLTTMLTQAGRDPGVTDLIAMPDFAEATR